MQFKMVHNNLNVACLAKSLPFYKEALGLEEACLFAYCPGCKVMHDSPDIRNLPAVTVNGDLKFWSVPATDDQLLACLSAGI